VLGTLSGEAFERKGTKARASVSRVFRRTVREVEVANEREERRAHTAIGGTVAHLEALIASGFRAGVIGLDPPWPFDTYNDRSPHVVRSKFETMPRRQDQGVTEPRARRGRLRNLYVRNLAPHARVGASPSKPGDL
jgi:hypothetical protein